MTRVLILGGTGDAVKLAQEVASLGDIEVTYSLAGRTKKPNLPDCKIRNGGFGGTAGLASYLIESEIDFVIDATHPFAQTMAHHANEACREVNIPGIKFCRPAWKPSDFDWISVSDTKASATKLVDLGNRVFLSIGTKDLDEFANLAEKWFLIRAVEKPLQQIPLPNHELILDRGPFDAAKERTLLVSQQIDVLVSKNSGGNQPAKLKAAYDLNIPIVMIEQPKIPDGEIVESIKECLKWLTTALGQDQGLSATSHKPSH